MRLLSSRPSDAAEMREAETGLVFQTVAERPIDAAMGKPDEGNRDGRFVWHEQAPKRHQDWTGERVKRIVGDRTRTRSCEIAEESEVGREEQNCEQPPVLAQPRIQHDCDREDAGTLDAQQHAGGAGYSGSNWVHGKSFLRDFVRHRSTVVARREGPLGGPVSQAPAWPGRTGGSGLGCAPSGLLLPENNAGVGSTGCAPTRHAAPVGRQWVWLQRMLRREITLQALPALEIVML